MFAYLISDKLQHSLSSLLLHQRWLRGFYAMSKFDASSFLTPISYKMDSVVFAIKGGTFLGVLKFEISFTFKTYNI